MRILLTGGTGYIGSHTAVILQESGHEVFLFDNLNNSKSSVVLRIAKITGCHPKFILGDVRNTPLLTDVLKSNNIDAVIHFAGLKAVGESSTNPIEYYSANVQGAISLIQAMDQAQVYQLVFSSSACVYGNPSYLPIDELHPTIPTNPYGRNKLQIEQMLQDVVQSDQGNPFKWKIASLRYFNPAGAHESGLIGEDPAGIPANLIPYVSQVTAGKLPALKIFGGDYSTSDGTGVRDYIHVMDLAEGHLAALNYLSDKPGIEYINLGTGIGYSVLDVVRAFERASSRTIEHGVVERRLGDIPSCYANADYAFEKLQWRALRNLEEMCDSAWRWQQFCSIHCLN